MPQFLARSMMQAGPLGLYVQQSDIFSMKNIINPSLGMDTPLFILDIVVYRKGTGMKDNLDV